MSSSLFNVLRFLAELGLPSLATLLAAIGTIWSLPVMVPVVATVIAVNTFVGALVGVRRSQYNS